MDVKKLVMTLKLCAVVDSQPIQFNQQQERLCYDLTQQKGWNILED